jgi:hypothetical protein
MKMFRPLLTKPAKGAKRVPNGGFWRFWYLLSVAGPIFLKSQRTAISGNSASVNQLFRFLNAEPFGTIRAVQPFAAPSPRNGKK